MAAQTATNASRCGRRTIIASSAVKTAAEVEHTEACLEVTFCVGTSVGQSAKRIINSLFGRAVTMCAICLARALLKRGFGHTP